MLTSCFNAFLVVMCLVLLVMPRCVHGDVGKNSSSKSSGKDDFSSASGQSSEPEQLPVLLVLGPKSAPAIIRSFRDVFKERSLNFSSVVLTAPGFGPSFDVFCTLIEKHAPWVLISLLSAPNSYFVALAASYVGLPLVSFTGSYYDSAAQEVNPHFLSLDPTNDDIADAAHQFLLANKWYHVALVMDNSYPALLFAHRLRELTSSLPWTPVLTIPFTPRNQDPQSVGDDRTMVLLLSSLLSSHCRVVMIFAEANATVDVFNVAKKLNMIDGQFIWIVVEKQPSPIRALRHIHEHDEFLRTEDKLYPWGTLTIRLRRSPPDKTPTLSAKLATLLSETATKLKAPSGRNWPNHLRAVTSSRRPSCWVETVQQRKDFSALSFKYLLQTSKEQKNLVAPVPPHPASPTDVPYSPFQERPHHQDDVWFLPIFDVLNLVPDTRSPLTHQMRWKKVGNVTKNVAVLDTVLWPGGSITGPNTTGRQRFRVATAYAPPFVHPSTRVANGSCLTGVFCLKINTSDPELISSIFASYHRGLKKYPYEIGCCAGIAIDLLVSIANDLGFDFDLYLSADGYFGTRRNRTGQWNGMTGDVISGAAHMAVSAYSVTSLRQTYLDFSVPFFHSGVSCLAYARKNDVPLSAFLIPFSYPLWFAIFLSLNITAVAAAIYEWFSPFGLNPWGRQRTKNFSMASALWVMWSLLFSHLVAFKAPKSWPNKVLINLWGCFSVIFLASYTANIAAHFAGLSLQLNIDDFHDSYLFNRRTGTARGTAAESYVLHTNPRLWEHIQRYSIESFDQGLELIKNGHLDVMIGDTAVLDYYRANDPTCTLKLLGDAIFDDAYAIGMQRGFPLKKAISDMILKYNELGYLDQLQKKWYGRVPCFDDSMIRLEKPAPLGVRAVAGVFIMLLIGLLVGVLTLIVEHLVFKYILPVLRSGTNKNSFWHSPNLMFFSQKFYRFINTVELVSPHHSAKEIMNDLREGQIASLFQKSVKRKIKEEARRRKSKSQFFEMIQEIRKVVQQQHRDADSPDAIMDVATTAGTSSSTVGADLPHPNRPALTRHYAIEDAAWKPTLHHGNPGKRASLQTPHPNRFNQIKHRNHHLLILPTMTTPELARRCSSSSSGGVYPENRRIQMQLSVSLDDLSLRDEETSSPSRTSSSSRAGYQRGCLVHQRSRSADDLRKLRRQLLQNSKFGGSSVGSTFKDSFGRRNPLAALAVKLPVDDDRLKSLSKQQLIRRWRDTQREILNALQETLREKRALEEKLAFIQRTLMKPP